MIRGSTCALAVLAMAASSGAQPSSVEPRISDYAAVAAAGLHFFDNWRARIPVGATVTCRGVLIANTYSLYCMPGKIVITLERERKGEPWQTRLITQVIEDFAVNARLMEGTRGAKAQIDPGRLTLNSDVIQSYGVSRRRTQEAIRITRPYMAETSRFMRKKLGGTIRTWFPCLSEADPFFHVYGVRDGIVTWVSEFHFTSEGVRSYPNWTFSTDRGGFPPHAQQYLADKKRWCLVE